MRNKLRKGPIAVVAAFVAIIFLVAIGCAAPEVAIEEPAVEVEEPAPEEEPAVEVEEPAPEEEPVVVSEDDRPPVNMYLVSHGSGAWDAFWVVVEQGNHDAARDLGVDLTLVTPPRFDPEQTASDIDRAVAANPDVLGVTVTDGVLYEEPLLRAIDAGIPVIAYNAADQRPEDQRIPYLTFIGQDEYTGGYEAGRRMIAAHDDAVRGVVVNQAVGHTGLDARANGFIDALAEDGIEAEVLAITEDPGPAVTTMGDYYASNPDVNLWLTLGPQGANPFYSFMESAGLQAGDIYHGTFDLGPEIVEKIKDGTSDFGIDQQPYVQGYQVVWWLAAIHRYGLMPPTAVTSTGPGFVDQTNIELVEEYAGTHR